MYIDIYIFTNIKKKIYIHKYYIVLLLYLAATYY